MLSRELSIITYQKFKAAKLSAIKPKAVRPICFFETQYIGLLGVLSAIFILVRIQKRNKICRMLPPSFVPWLVSLPLSNKKTI